MSENPINNKTPLSKIAGFFSSAIILLTFLLTAIAFLGSLVTMNSKATLFAQKGATLGTPLSVILVIIGAAALVIIWRWMFKLINNASQRTIRLLSCGLLAIFTAVCAVMCIFLRVNPFTDSETIQDMALQMAKDDTLHIDTTQAYFQNYSNNDLLTILLSLFFRFLMLIGVSDYAQACIWLNAACIVTGELFAFFGVKSLIGEKGACRYLILSVMQPVMYLTVCWSYSNTMCLPFMCGLFLIAARTMHAKSTVSRCILGAAFGAVAAVGYFIRPVVMIEAIAFAISALLYVCGKKGRLKQLAACITAAVVMISATTLGMQKFVNEYGGDNSRNYPLTHWLMMGLHEHGRFSRDDSSFTRRYKTKEEKKQANIAEIKKSLKRIGVLGMPVHAVTKHCITWSEGSANYYLRAKHIDKENQNALAQLIIGKNRSYVMLYCQIYRAAMLFLASAGMLMMLRKKRMSLLFPAVLTVLGGMIFYLFWEAKESYSIPFLFLLVMTASLAADRLRLPRRKSRQAVNSDIVTAEPAEIASVSNAESASE